MESSLEFEIVEFFSISNISQRVNMLIIIEAVPQDSLERKTLSMSYGTVINYERDLIKALTKSLKQVILKKLQETLIIYLLYGSVSEQFIY